MKSAYFSSLAKLALSLVVCGMAPAAAAQERLPNIVIIFTDDQGYADVGVYGAKGFATPHLDRMAREGVRFTDFYVAQAVCSASRAALLTGAYPNRIGIGGALGPNNQHGLHDDEMTLAELVKQRDYATGIFGKWHLGHHPEFLPTRHGFDEFFGIPYSNDMWPLHPTARPGTYPPLPLLEGEEVVRHLEDQTDLTVQLTERAVRFIEKNKERPFFLYLPHPQPHVPLFVSDRFKGKSEQGLYGDVIMEIDWSVGRILEVLREHGLDEHTLVMFASDNGPWLSYGDHSGSAAPLREGKGTSWEGGKRVPCIMRWPGKIPEGIVCREPAMTIDILPTIAGLIQAGLPHHKIDGKDIWPLISGQPQAKSPHPAYFFYYANDQLQAVRSGPWKLYFPHTYRTLEGKPGGTDGNPVPYASASTGLELYNLENDLSETINLADQHPRMVKRLEEFAETMRQDLGDQLTGRLAVNARAPGRVSNPASSAAGRSDDWIILFDGQSTAHWRGFQEQTFPEASWKIDNGALSPRVDGPVIDLITRNQFQNFELELEWRVAPNGNAGIFFHVTEDHPQVWFTGPEFQVLDDQNHPDGLDPKTSAGSLFGLIAPSANKKLRPLGEYNQAKVVVRGPRVEHWLNGVKILEFNFDSDEFKRRVAGSKFNEMPDFARHRQGHVALQHASVSPLKAPVWYRNIRIRPLNVE
jgi:arylsulfatase A